MYKFSHKFITKSRPMFEYESKLVDSSRILADILAGEIVTSQKKYDEMLSVAMLDKYPVSMRAARILGLCQIKNEILIKPHIRKIVQSLNKIKIEGVKRGFLKILSENPDLINEDSLGLLADMAFEWIVDPKQAVAIKIYSVDLLVFVVKKYPELVQELVSSLEIAMEDGSKGVKSKCKHTLKKLRQIRQ